MKPANTHSDRVPSRRSVLLGGAAIGTCVVVPGLIGLAIPGGAPSDARAMEMESHAATRLGVPRAPFEKYAPLVEPQVRRSVNGALSTTLRIGYTYKDLGGYRLSLRSYEQDLPGPTLRVRRGDVLRIRLVNGLPPNPDLAPLEMILPHQFNSTNFHFHGGHVSPAASPTMSSA